jgi:hypothetical protein
MDERAGLILLFTAILIVVSGDLRPGVARPRSFRKLEI